MRKRYVSFSLAAGSYCIPVDQVMQILRRENLIEVPKAPPFVEGVLNLRGDIIPVIDLRARLDISPAEGGAGPRLIHASGASSSRRLAPAHTASTWMRCGRSSISTKAVSPRTLPPCSAFARTSSSASRAARRASIWSSISRASLPQAGTFPAQFRGRPDGGHGPG